MKSSVNCLLILIVALFMFGATSCASDAIDDTPSSVSGFITQYFPNVRVKSWTPIADGGHKAVLENSATIVFDKENKWIDIDGEGVTLPEVLIYDQLPPSLYSFLQAIEQQRGVYAVTRDNFYYKLRMLDTVLTYTIATEAITYPGEMPEGDKASE